MLYVGFTFGYVLGVICGAFLGIALIALCMAQKHDEKIKRCNECGKKLTDEEIYYYDCTCEKCERKCMESDE